MPNARPSTDSELARGMLWGYAGQMSFYIISFVFTVFVAYAFPKDSVGVFYLGISIIGMIGILADLGFSGTLGRFIPFFEGKGERGKITHLALLGYSVALSSGLILSVLVFLLSRDIAQFYHVPELEQALRILFPLLLLNSLAGVSSAFLRGRADIKSVSAIQILQNSLKLVIVLLLFGFLGATLDNLCIALVLSVAGALAISVVRVGTRMKDLPPPSGRFPSFELLWTILPVCATISILGSLGIVFSGLTQLLFGYLIPPDRVTGTLASFSIAISLGSFLSMFPSSVIGILTPVLSRLLGAQDKEELKRAAHRSQRWVLLSMMPFALALSVFSKEALSALFGNAYSDGSALLSGYALSLLFSSLAQIMTVPLSVSLKLRTQVLIMIISGLSALAFNITLISLFGMDGVGIAAVLTSLVTLFSIRHFSLSLTSIGFSAGLGKILLSGLMALAALFLIRLALSPSFGTILSQPAGADQALILSLRLLSLFMLASAGSVAGLLFLALIVAMKGLNQGDVDAARALLHRVPFLKIAEKPVLSFLAGGVPG